MKNDKCWFNALYQSSVYTDPSETNLQIGNVLENKWIGDIDLSFDLVVHRINVSLVDGHALFRQ